MKRLLDVAIVGMACRFPGSKDLCAFWENIVRGVDLTSEVPVDRWNPADFFDPTSTANDRVNCRRGGYLDSPITFDPASHGMMPNAVDGGEPEQFLVLETAKTALLDAGFTEGVPDGKRVEVIIGRGNYFNRGNLTRLQHGRIVAQTLDILKSLHPDWSEADRELLRNDLKLSLPPFGPASIPGQLTNATAGRIANRFDLSGASYVVDAASASSLVALHLGARSLIEHQADVAIIGGVYLEADVDFPMVFRQLGASSVSGRSRPYSRDADGMLSGEGVGVLVIKRRVDAERDGNRIYSVLQGLGIASDGRGLSLTSPSARGHARAIRQAYRTSGIDPSTIGLIEGHGLGVPIADRAEIRAIRSVFPPAKPGRRSLSAVSELIGHAMPAAGMAGIIKASLSLHHRLIPPSLSADKPHRWVTRADSPVSLNQHARPWIHGDESSPRRAGVNAFGFSGINTHAILEEHQASADSPDSPGALANWESEAILLSSTDREGLVRQAEMLLDWLKTQTNISLKDLAYTLNTTKNVAVFRLGLVVTSIEDLSDRIENLLPKLKDWKCQSIRDTRGSYLWERQENSAPRIAFLFPGEGSQYPRMLADLCPHFPEIRALFDTSDRLAREAGAIEWPSEHLFLNRNGDHQSLWSANIAVNIVLSAQWALYQLLMRLGLKPNAIVGHSSGELLALAASGVLQVDRSFEDKLGELGSLFGQLENSGLIPTARLVAVASNRSIVEQMISNFAESVSVAIDNCPHQVVIAGKVEAVEKIVLQLCQNGISFEELPFSRAYHTPGFATAMAPIESFFHSLQIRTPLIPIYSCASEALFPENSNAIRQLATDQWKCTVGFRRTIEKMHEDGLNVFVDVGARGNLAGFVEDTLRSRSAFAVAANMPRRSGLTQLNHLVASLFAKGVDLQLDHLYARRRPSRIDVTHRGTPIDSSLKIQVGFPVMKLSPEVVEKFRKRPFQAENDFQIFQSKDSNKVHTEHRYSESGQMSRNAQPTENGLAQGSDSDQILIEFQSTMTHFLKTQDAVMSAFLVGDGPTSLPFNHGSAKTSQFMSDPWSGELVSMIDGQEVVSIVRLGIEGDPVAENHTLGGRRISASHPEWRGLPVLPFSVMAEMLAQAGRRLIPRGVLIELRNVLAQKWIRYEDVPIALEIRAHVEESGLVKVSIHNRGPADAMRTSETAVFEGLVVFADETLDGPISSDFTLEDPQPCRFTAQSIYREQWLFHGPALQAVVGIGPISMAGIEGTLRILPMTPLLRGGEDPSRILIDPIILDNFTHLLGAWGLDRLADNGDVIFPLRMNRLTLFGARPPEGSDVKCRIAINELEEHRVQVDADIVSPDGRLWMAIRGWEDWRFHWPGRYRDGFRQPEKTFLGELLTLRGSDQRAVAVWLEPPADMSRPIWRDVLEHVQLGPDERSDYLKLSGPEMRRTHRLWGRIAAKEAVRRLMLRRGEGSIYPADLIVIHDQMGQPSLRFRASTHDKHRYSISIAHVDGVAVALACFDLSSRVGIDVEPIIERSSSFESTAFLSSERALLDRWSGPDRAEWVARFWCAKEALAKATGLGFVEGPLGVEVVSVGPGGILGLRLRGRLANECSDLNSKLLRVLTERRDHFAWAWTLAEGME